MIDVIDEDRVPRRAAVRIGPGGEPGFEHGLAERLPSTPERMVSGQSRSSLEPRFFERMSDEDLREISHDEAEDLEFLRSLGMRSAITVALQARGEVTGALTVGVAWSRRRYRREDVAFRLDPLRARRPCPRQLGALRRPRAGRAGAGRDRRDPAARPAALATAAHSRLVDRGDVSARGSRERGRRRFLRRVPSPGRMDAGDRRRDRPRRPRRLDHRGRSLHAAHRGCPHRRSPGRPARPSTAPCSRGATRLSAASRR